MKILIKSYCGVYNCLKSQSQSTHCSSYYPFLFREIFRRLGHTCNFIGQTKIENEILDDLTGYDILIFWGLESFTWDTEYSTKILKEFKGPRVLFITDATQHPIFNEFTHIIATDVPSYVTHYKTLYPNVITNLVYFTAPLFDFVDLDLSNPYLSDEKKVTYIGVLYPRNIEPLNKIAESGIPLYIGGTYYPPDAILVRGFTEEEKKHLLHPNIHLYSNDGSFKYGEHWKFLKHATVGLNFASGRNPSNCNSKIIDYLISGLPVVSEDESPNAFHLNELSCGYLAKTGNTDDLIMTLKKALNTTWDKDTILNKSRERFNSLTIGKQILDYVK